MGFFFFTFSHPESLAEFPAVIFNTLCSIFSKQIKIKKKFSLAVALLVLEPWDVCDFKPYLKFLT